MQIVDRSSSIIIWLKTISAMVFAMVFIGGITRLTDSGLSMVDWKPIMGAIPPLSESDWLIAFDKYKAYPEFRLLKSSMDLDGFKAIFFWEYFHRLFGRLIGLAFIIPYLYFLIRKSISKSLNIKLIFAFFLGGAQGLMGWYMVKSGLVNKPDVSHYRLAAHLSLAFVIIAYLYWVVLGIKNPLLKLGKGKPLSRLLISFTVLVIMQVVYGAFVAGLDAGLTHNTFPKMGRAWVPSDFYSVFTQFYNIFENPVVVQFIHRCMAWGILFFTIVFIVRLKVIDDFMQKRSFQYLIIMVVIQFLLGVFTLLNFVPISLASLHQVGACLLILLCVRCLFFSFCTAKQ